MAKNIRIQILGWDKYNRARKDVDHPSWFRFNHDFFNNSKFYDLTLDERLAWIYVLCERSKRTNCTVFNINVGHFEDCLKLPKTVLNKSLKKLEENHVIKIDTYRERTADVTSTCLQTDNTDKHNKQTRQTNTTDPEILAAQNKLLEIRKKTGNENSFLSRVGNGKKEEGGC